MAKEQREIPQENVSNETYIIPNNNVSILPRRQKVICLFGKIIDVEPSLLEFEETEKETDEDLKTHSSLEAECSKPHKEGYVPLDLSLRISGNPNINSKVTCAGINKDLTEDARDFKKMRSLPKEERVLEAKRAGVLTELPPYTWTISKTLTQSDINRLSRLMLDTTDAESHIMRHLSTDVQKTIQQGNEFKVKAYDHDTDTEHDMVFKRHVKTSKSYVFNGGWAAEFVRRRGLKQGDTIGLFWGIVDSRLHFCVLKREP